MEGSHRAGHNLLYISNGEAIDNVPTFDEWPTNSNRYIKPSSLVSYNRTLQLPDQEMQPYGK